MARKPKPEKPSAEILAPIPAEILDQIVRDGPLTAEEIDTAARRFKEGAHRASARRRIDAPPRLPARRREAGAHH